MPRPGVVDRSLDYPRPDAAASGARAPRHMTKNVLLLAKGLGRGGAERLHRRAASATSTAAAIDVEVAYVLPWKDAFVAELEAAASPSTASTGAAALDPRWVGRLHRLVRDRGIDLVHTHMPLPAVARPRRRCPRRLPVIVHTEHNLWDRYRPPTRVGEHAHHRAQLGRSSRCRLRSARRCGSPHWAPDAPPGRGGAARADVRGPSGAGPDARRPGASSSGSAADELVVGTVGNFTSQEEPAHRCSTRSRELAARASRRASCWSASGRCARSWRPSRRRSVIATRVHVHRAP